MAVPQAATNLHQPRLRRESYGELVQIDGSQHRWFEDRGEPCMLLVFIDDATSKLMQLRFVPSESTSSYFEALQGYLETHGSPVAFYSDKHSVFRMNRDATGGQGMTQFGRALAELNIEILCANSSQSKGRVERANRTLQDRLVKELRLAGISSVEAGNAFLPAFIERFNESFAIAPAKLENLHRKVHLPTSRLSDILCHREQRYVSAQLSSTMIAGKSSWNATRPPRSLPASMSISTTTPTARSRSDGRASLFPIASSPRTGGSRRPQWSRTSASAKRSRL